jgi:hypothetical protein
MSLRRGTSAAASKRTTATKKKEEEPPFEIEEEELPVVEEEEEDTEPPTSDPGAAVVGKGWDSASNNRSGDFADRIKLSSEPVLVKFLTDEPFTWRQHFIQSENKAFVCLRDTDKGCPLCAVGDQSRARHMLSVADLSGDEVEVKKLEFGNRLLDDLKAAHEGPRGPLTRYCVRISSRGKGFDTRYVVDVVKDRDLEEEEKITAEDVERETKGLEPLGPEAIYVAPRETLAEVAETVVSS